MKNLQIVEMAAKIAETITAAKMHDPHENYATQQSGELAAEFYSAVFNSIYKTLQSACEDN